MSRAKLMLGFWKPVLVIMSVFAVTLTIIHTESVSSQGGQDQKLRTGCLILLVAVLWTSEALPLEVSSLVPVVALPLLGIMDTGSVAKEYFTGANMLLLAAMGVAAAAQNVGIHKRLALRVLMLAGTGRRSLLAAFMLITTLLSMFICNTATCAMMIPILTVVLDQLYQDTGDPSAKTGPGGGNVKLERIMFFLAVGYCANIGGTGTLTAEETNIIIMQVLDEFPTKQSDLSYSSWIFYSFPLVIVILIFTFLWLMIVFMRRFWVCEDSRNAHVEVFIKSKYKELGPMKFKEYAVMSYFLLLIVIWFFAEPNFIDGWSEWFQSPDGGETVSEATPAIFILILILITPEHMNFWPFIDEETSEKIPFPGPIMDWKTLSRFIPWGLLILRGAGFALAKASDESGLSLWIGDQMTGLSDLPGWAILTLILLTTSVLNELVSNATTASILLPVLKDISVQLRLNPLYLMLPVTLSCNYTFLLPASCPPNALVYKASGMRMYHMILGGLGVKIITFGLSLVAANTYGGPLLGMNEFPAWANETVTP